MKEQTINERQLQTLDQQTVTAMMRQVLKRQEGELLQWQVQEIPHATGPATSGVYRLMGTGKGQGWQEEWSLILKILRPTSAGKRSTSSEQEHVLYWKREALVYESGLLNDLPGGLRGPRCYELVEQADGSVWLWLEEVTDRYGQRWPLTQYTQAAYSLGQLNGAYLAGRPLPAFPWLVKSGSPRGLLDHYSWMWKTAYDPATWQHPLLRSAFPIPIAERLCRLWEDREALLDVFESFPQTFCHLDAWRGNLFAVPQTDGGNQLVAIDWAYPGLGSLATDIGDLMAPSFGLFRVEPCDPRTMGQMIFESYIEGLAAAGWQGNHQMVHCSFALFMALKYSCALFWLDQITDESQHASWQQRRGQPLDECLHNQAALIYYLLDLADEARRSIAAM